MVGLPPTGLPMMMGQGPPPSGLAGTIKPEQAGTLPAAFEKKLRRLEKNRESARGTSIRKPSHFVVPLVQSLPVGSLDVVDDDDDWLND